MSHQKQYIEVFYAIKDPAETQRARKPAVATKARLYSPPKPPVTARTSRLDSPDNNNNDRLHRESYAYNNSRSGTRGENGPKGCVARKRDKNHNQVPYSRDRIHVNTSGPVLRDSCNNPLPLSISPRQDEDLVPWSNAGLLGNRSILLIEQDEEISKYRFTRNMYPTPNNDSFLAPNIDKTLNSTGKARPQTDLPVFRNRDAKPNTNGAVLNLPKHRPTAKQDPSLLTPREQVVPDNGVIWNNNPVPTDENDGVRRVRAPADMSRQAFYDQYAVTPRSCNDASTSKPNTNRIVLAPAADALGINLAVKTSSRLQATNNN
jgi:hypothetical protein